MQNIEEIYKQHCNTVYKYLFCLTHDENISEELTQETFAIAVKEINKFKGNCKVSVWLCQIAKHLWYKELKKNKKVKDIPIEELTEELQISETTEDIICNNEDKLKLFKNMQVLDEQSKEVMYLRITGNLNFIEIAEILGKTPNWARVTFYRAKQKIREVSKIGKED
ncbi:MAG TPA: sigma-70 family RNA polymerase sigma factor [Clostridiaceae bacterium]|nr:sigma-70 family RNA polymerase sigma factor [Clostridiaceae bacterium]